MVELQKILNDHPELFSLEEGNSNHELLGVCPPEASKPAYLCFMSTSKHVPLLPDLQCPLWIISSQFWKDHSESLRTTARKKLASIVVCKNLQAGMAQVLSYFDRHRELLAFPQGVSPHVWIHPNAKIGKNVSIGPYTTIGPHTRVGDNTVIGPHCTIEGEVELGESCFLEGNIFIGRQCRLGRFCHIKPFATIGTDGFGYAPTSNGALKIPQLGIVYIEDFVDIGANTCIDRATLTQTRIGQGTKIDNLVHIAHNCDIGRYCFLTAGFAIAGSSKIGDFFMTGGTSSVGDHVDIPEKVTLAGATVVTSSIEKPGAYGGNPVQPMNDYLKTRASMAQLPLLRKQVAKILKHLGLNE